ncbi:MAG TPA: NAD(P)H-dependent oxidoreductase [Gammaproteobacteria bacterium]|nr:NAD(P)H-dependent oxidoreductase [Gammaproteobacteria bacterium]
MHILCLSGSLRALSYNTAVLYALKQLAPAHIQVGVFEQMKDLPLFNPDIENENIAPVSALQDEVYHADGLIIASPEYAHGISGVLKNALDWLVAGDGFPLLPVALINTSPRAHHAQDALREVLATMSATVVDPACIDVPLLGSDLGTHEIVKHTEIADSLLAMTEIFYQSVIAGSGDRAQMKNLLNT